jgi:uncharacterized membrane protein
MVPPSPPPPPRSTPPPPPAGGGGGKSENRGLMIVLSYLGLLAIIPLLMEKEDKEIQWHAKHGLVIFVAEFILFAVSFVFGLLPVIGTCLAPIFWVIVLIAAIVIAILCIVKGINGERFLIPGLSQFADRF